MNKGDAVVAVKEAVMDHKERKQFWNVLINTKDTSSESLAALNAVYTLPQWLFRFRTVSESSLYQLQDNKLYFSSADYYDDPFDTYFYIDYDRIRTNAKQLDILVHGNSEDALRTIHQIIPNVNTLELLRTLQETDFCANDLKDRFLKIRNLVHQQLYSICFCENPWNETLWLKYADNHRGFMLMYDPSDTKTFFCGKNPECVRCPMEKPHPNIYPVYYTDEKYDATKFGLGVLLQNIFPANLQERIPWLMDVVSHSLQWESERISLIKKECHKYDEEWRMICPFHSVNRPCIKMKPTCVVLGLRMPEYKRKLVVSAAQVAEIPQIKEMFINESDELDMRLIDRKS